MKELGSEVARQAEGSQPTQPNPNPNHDRTGRPVVCSQNTSRSSNQEIDTRFSRDCKNANLDVNAILHGTERPVVCSQNTSRSSYQEIDTSFSRDCKSVNLDVEANHDRTERPVVCSQQAGSYSMFNEVDIDFRISGLPQSVVKQTENSLVRELVKKIENHPHRQDLQADLQQNNAYNPFSEKSKKMIKDIGNVELFELCETNPKVQCKECFLYWNQGIVYCTCGHLLKESEASRGILQWTLDHLSIQNYVIEKGRPHGHRFGKTQEQKDRHIAHNLRKRCMKRGFKGIHDCFLKDDVLRESQFEIDRTEEVCIQTDKDAQKDFTYRMTKEEYFRCKKNWWISLINLEKIGPVRDHSDFNDALSTSHRLHQESGQEQLRPIPFWRYLRWHSSSSSSSSTWWQWSDSWWSS